MTKEELFAVMEQIAGEREAARPVVEKLIASGEPLEDIEIPEEWRTAGMVLELCGTAYSKNESAPRLSLLLGQLALPIAISVPFLLLSRYLQARAWREIGYANRYLCTYEAGFVAYLNAEKIFGELGLAYDVATTQLAYAGILLLAHRQGQCSNKNAAAREVFREFGIEHQVLKCDVLDAMLAADTGQFETARNRFEELLRRMWNTGDLHTLGVTYQSLGLMYRALGKFSEAVDTFHRARQIFLAADMPSEVNRADWGLGVVLMDRGEAERALHIFARLREDYLSRNMPEEAGEIGLWMLDALVATGQIDWARRLVQTVLNEFIAAKLHKNAITALSYLRDLLQISANPTPAIRHVRSYVERMRTQPTLQFLPIDS